MSGGPRRKCHRNRHEEPGPHADGAFHGYVAAQKARQPATEGKPKARPSQPPVQWSFHLREVVEDMLQCFRRDADARIAHGKRDSAIAVHKRTDADLALWRELQRIRNEVSKDLRKLAVIREQSNVSMRFLERQRQLLVRQDGLEHAAQRGEEVDHLEPFRRYGQATRLQFRQVELVVHELEQFVSGRAHERHLFSLLGRERTIELAEQDSAETPDGA